MVPGSHRVVARLLVSNRRSQARSGGEAERAHHQLDRRPRIGQNLTRGTGPRPVREAFALDSSHLRIRRVTDPADPAIAAFGELQERVYADPDLLIPPQYLPVMLARQSADRLNLMLVAELQGRVVGGVVFHCFPPVRTGFSSFMAVAPEERGRGLARRLHEARFAALDAAAGERGPVHGLFIDVVAPERLSPVELEQERAVGSDPVARRAIFHRLGFRRVDVAYFQPAEGSGGEPITSMDLLYCPREGAEWVETELVVGTMQAYWTPWLGRAAAERNAAELRRRCGGERVRLLPG
ncbi:MAG: GNAT family N-acetyltransferase [Bacillota bacterium]